MCRDEVPRVKTNPGFEFYSSTSGRMLASEHIAYLKEFIDAGGNQAAEMLRACRV